MAYACPVCDTVEADGEHLANHLAITAIRGDAAHADWLDEHAPDWAEEDPPGLAERVTPLADPVEVEGTTQRHGGSPTPQRGQGDHGMAAGVAPDDDTREALQAARDLTERMLSAEDGETDEGAANPDANGPGDETGS